MDTKACEKIQQQWLRQGITQEARRYAVKELARRAGITRHQFDRWKIEITATHTIVTISDDAKKRIRFEHAPTEVVKSLADGNVPVSTAAWLETPKDNLLEQFLVIPFVESPEDPSLPLFQPTEDGSFVCKIDLLLSLLLTLSRAEEMIVTTRDEHGRFPASASVAWENNFLERPIVDEYGLAFTQVLEALLPSLKRERPSLKVKLTHDIDGVGVPFELRSALGHTLKRRKPAATFRDVISAFSEAEPTELLLVRALAKISKERGLHSAFFWKGCQPGPKDSGYDPCGPKVQRVVSDLKNQGFEVGVHPAYDTFESRTKLQDEVDFLRKALGVHEMGGRQHYLRWSPQTWRDWESCQLSYDSSVGYADCLGFRAGTSVPFRPWNFHENRELDLVEVPLIVMDCTPVKYMKLSRRQGLERIRKCIQRIELTGGVFTLLWHNFPLLEPEYDGWYESILDMLPSGRNYSLPSSLASFW